MNLGRCLAIAMFVMAHATAVWGATPVTMPTERDLAAARAVFVTMSYSGEDEIRVDLDIRESPLGTYYEIVRARRGYGGSPAPFRWSGAQFPMEFSVRLDEDGLPDRVVLTLTHKEPATVGLPPPYSATVDASLYLTTAPLGEPNLTLPLTSRPFHHPGFETRHTPHGVEVLYWEEVGTMKNGEFDELSIWTMQAAGTFERTLDPTMGDSVVIVDLDEDETHEVIVRSRSTFAHPAMADYWVGQLAYTKDILRWDGVRYSRAPAEVAAPYIRRTSRDEVASYPRDYNPDYAVKVAKLDLMEAIENCYYWGATELGKELLDQYEDELRGTGPTNDEDVFAHGVERVIAKWRTGVAWAGKAYGDPDADD